MLFVENLVFIENISFFFIFMYNYNHESIIINLIQGQVIKNYEQIDIFMVLIYKFHEDKIDKMMFLDEEVMTCIILVSFDGQDRLRGKLCT